MAYNRKRQEVMQEELTVYSVREMAPSGGWKNGWWMQILHPPHGLVLFRLLTCISSVILQRLYSSVFLSFLSPVFSCQLPARPIPSFSQNARRCVHSSRLPSIQPSTVLLKTVNKVHHYQHFSVCSQ